MSRNAKILSAIAAAVLFAAVGLVAFVNLTGGSGAGSSDTSFSPATVAHHGAAPIAAGKLASDFKLTDLKGRTVSLSALHGKVVFLNIWATWCAPCRDEMPSIESLYQKFNKDKDFVVLAVSQDTAGPKVVVPFVEKNKLTFTVLLDPQNQVGDAYGVSGIPETFIIGRDGRIVAHHLGPYDWSNPEIRDALQELINSKPG